MATTKDVLEFAREPFEDLVDEIVELREKVESIQDLASDIDGLKYVGELEEEGEIFNSALEEALALVNNYID